MTKEMKYIGTIELAELTGRNDDEIRELAKSGVLPAHKTRRGYWRFNVDDVEKYFGIQINKPYGDKDDNHGAFSVDEFRNICREQQGMFREMIGEPMGSWTQT